MSPVTPPRCILLIVIDCLRADHVSAYGYPLPTTPALDAMAREGILWEQAYSVCSWTRPAVTTLLTGLYPTQHGVFQGIKRSRLGSSVHTDVLSPAVPTLASALEAAGWRCAAFLDNTQLGKFSGLDRGFATYIPQVGKADRHIELWSDWLLQNLSIPSFAYLHFMEAHWPFKPRRRHIAMFGGNRDTNLFRDFSARDFGRLRRAVIRGRQSLTPVQLRHMVQMYDGAVRRLDGKLRRIRRVLEKARLLEHTAIVVTSDHGEEFLDHGAIGHGHSLHEELVRVPLIMRAAAAPAGARPSNPVSLVDLAGTLASLANVRGALPGKMLLENPSTSPVYSELRIRSQYTQAVRGHRWKLHRNYHIPSDTPQFDRGPLGPAELSSLKHRCRLELYDLATDPYEKFNLAEKAALDGVRHKLTRLLDEWWKACTQTAVCEEQQPLDDQVIARLRDLGYIE